jgi:nucleoside-diphosphate-sugar epimerase
MKLCITGFSGFIGTELRRQAAAAGHSFVCLGEILPDRAQIDRVPWREFDAVIHLSAAGVNFGSPSRTWEQCMAVNFHGTRELLESIKASGAAPTIFIPGSVREEEMSDVLRYWADPYIVTKRLSGLFVKEWQRDYRGLVLRPIIGRCKDPGQVESVVARILEEITQ